MPIVRDILGGINSMINPTPTPTYPAGPVNTGQPMTVDNSIPPNNMIPPQMGFNGMNPSGVNYPTPILENYQNALSNIPEWRKPNILRMLMTGAYSALQRTPDETIESYDKEGRMSKQVHKGHWDPFDYKETDAILNQPNYRDIDLWKMKTDALGKGASVENSINNNKSLANQRSGNLDVAQDREGRLTTQGNRALDIKKDALEIQRKAQETKDWIARNPKGIVKEIRGGNIVVIDPINGDITDTGLHSGLLTEKQKLDILGKQKMDVVGAQQAGATSRNDADNAADLKEIERRAEEARKTKGTPSASSGVNSQLPTQQKQALILKTNQVIAEHPEWENFIEPDDNGLPKIKTGWRGPSEAVRKEITSALYGSTNSTAPTNSTIPSTEKLPAKAPAGKVGEPQSTNKPTPEQVKVGEQNHLKTMKSGMVLVKDPQGHYYEITNAELAVMPKGWLKVGAK